MCVCVSNIRGLEADHTEAEEGGGGGGGGGAGRVYDQSVQFRQSSMPRF